MKNTPQRFYEIKPDNHQAYYNWGITLMALAKLKPKDQAAGLYRQALDKLHKCLELGGSGYNLGCCYALTGDKANALRYLQQSLDNKEQTPAFVKADEDWQAYLADAKSCVVPAEVVQHLIDWLIFNIIIGNSDAHGKNVSFFVGNHGVTIAPFYDLVSVIFEAANNEKVDTSLAMAIGDNFNSDTITAFDLLSLADESGISFTVLKRRVVRMATKVAGGISTLDLADCPLSTANTKVVTAMKPLILRRANHLLMEVRQMDNVAKEAF